MTELEGALIALAGELELPPVPDLSDAVAGRIERRRPGRRLVLAFAVVVAALAVAFAVPPARTAILRFFHIGAVSIERVETLPPAEERPLVSGLGSPLTRAKAERVAGFQMILPRGADESGRRFYARPGLISTLFGGDRPVLLTELAGAEMGLAKKFTTETTSVEPVRVGAAYDGIWIQGGPHVLAYEPSAGHPLTIPTRLAGNVLVWEADGLTFRIEGEGNLAAALELAHSLEP